MAAQNVALRDLSTKVDHQSELLMSMMKIVQDLQLKGLTTDKRLGGLESNFEQMVTKMGTSAEVPGVKGPAPSSSDSTGAGPMESGDSSKMMTLLKDCNAKMDKMGKEVTSLKGKVTSFIHDVKVKLDELSSKLDVVAEKEKNLSDRVRRLTKISLFSNMKVKEQVSTLQTSADESTGTVLRSIDLQTEEVKTAQETIGKGLGDRLKVLETVKKDLETNGRVMNMVRGESRAVIDQLVAEVTLMKQVVRGENLMRGTYTCDFFVHDFSHCVGSDGRQFSRLWWVEEINTHLKGYVEFKADKNMTVWLIHGQYPKVLGLNPIECGQSISVKVTAVRRTGTGADWELGSAASTGDWSTSEIGKKSDGWLHIQGCRLVTTVKCSEMDTRGVVCDNNKVLLRFLITVS